MFLEFLSDEELTRLRNEGKLIGPLSSVPLKALSDLVESFRNMPLESVREFVRMYKPSTPKSLVGLGRTAFAQGYISTKDGLEMSLETYRIIE